MKLVKSQAVLNTIKPSGKLTEKAISVKWKYK